MTSNHDIEIIRQLAEEYAALARLPIQEEKRKLWRSLNARKPVRPMVMIDQVCWNEMNIGDELTVLCEDQDCRVYETELRQAIYQWHHFPVDRVLEPYMSVTKAVQGNNLGVQIHEQTVTSDPTNSVVGHKYENQFLSESDLDKIRIPEVSHDSAETERRVALAHTLFDGILEVRLQGVDPSYQSMWDQVSMWMGVENALYALVDQPELIHALLSRVVQAQLSILDQLEEQNLLCGPQPLIHCTGAYTDDLPAPGFNPQHPRLKDLWMFAMAQMFSSVSPAMFEEFEIDYTRRICERFGIVYYGCCEPLDSKMEQVRMLPNVRKISMSPWVDQDLGAARIGTDYVYSRKPSPALVATDVFHPEQVRADLLETRTACQNHGCPLEIILKDISTVRYEPQRLDQWARIAMEVVGA